jgi:hypothetical protein
MAIVYRHIRLDTNQPFYIGMSGLEKRPYEIRNRNKHWKNIVSETEYRVEILFDDLDLESACEKEKEFIALYGRTDLGNGILCNMTDGGLGNKGIVFSEEYRRKISEAVKGRIMSEDSKRKISEANRNPSEETRRKKSEAATGKVCSEEKKAKIANSLRGKVISKEAREKLSKSLKGRIFSEEHRKKLSGVANNASKTVLDTQTGIYYDSANDAFKAIVLSFSPRHFRGMLSGRCNNKTTMIYA